MTTFTLKQPTKQLFEVQPERSHPKISVRRVLWVKVIRWIDKSSSQVLWKATQRLLCVGTIACGVFARDITFEALAATLRWNGYKVPVFLLLIASVLNAKRLWLWSRRTIVKRRGSNQHTYRGIPVGELATWLIEQQAFKRDESIRTWGLSQGHYQKIAEELESHCILKRGENNSRVLREITMEQLVLQLRDDFPLVWSEERQVWAERNGAFERWALSQDAKDRKREEKIARRERKLERLDEAVSDRTSMADVLALCQ